MNQVVPPLTIIVGLFADHVVLLFFLDVAVYG